MHHGRLDSASSTASSGRSDTQCQFLLNLEYATPAPPNLDSKCGSALGQGKPSVADIVAGSMTAIVNGSQRALGHR
ncbi:hypothetical protein EVAR_33440_1 [Eumeta japonica]|uniref:Uncharacterized protein n=1 Tax=Eumeta variegata TaxID=151549 RepID=A0A4C1W1S0_EUMVA|nr:hypothetical protein EVAR_33440_1 [Eumeta japonica]